MNPTNDVKNQITTQAEDTPASGTNSGKIIQNTGPKPLPYAIAFTRIKSIARILLTFKIISQPIMTIVIIMPSWLYSIMTFLPYLSTNLPPQIAPTNKTIPTMMENILGRSSEEDPPAVENIWFE